MKKNTQSRKWLLTINNPTEKGFNHERIKQELSQLKSIVYYCMSDEIGLDEQTPHTHVFIACSSAVRFSTIKNHFSEAHIDPARGTSQENHDYVFKLGKWENDEKSGTRVPDTQEEWGEMPQERRGSRKDLSKLYEMIKDGMSDFEILEACPEYMFAIDKIDRARQAIKKAETQDLYREINCIYIYGKTRTGKTRGVMEAHGYSEVFRVTNYIHPFDKYEGQKNILFDEFRSSMKIQDILEFLDGYPLFLPCRYADKVACYDTVYIISNIPLEAQYPNIQRDERETWDAFLQRIKKVIHYTGSEIIEYDSTASYFERFEVIQEDLGVF